MGKTHHKSIILQAIEHLDTLKAIGKSRYIAKQAARAEAAARGEKTWSPSTGKYHSHGSRNSYQPHILCFINWVRDTEGIKDLQDLWPHADELVSRYLKLRLQEHKSPWTYQTIRSALRFFFSDHHLAEGVVLPERKREKITKSRRPVAKDKKLQPAHWQPLLTFEKAVGLRKNELRRILVKEIREVSGELFADVSRGKGGKAREVPVLPGREQDVLSVVADRDPEERIFPRLPDTEVQDLRREYAQKLYLHYAGPGWTLPPTDRRLRPTDYDRDAVERVSKALGHTRRDVVLNNYLR